MTNKTKALICFAVALCGCTNPPTKRWVYVAANDHGAKFYLDSTSVKDNGGGIVRAVELADYPDDGSDWRSMTTLVIYNCGANTSAVIRSSFFSGPMATGQVRRTREESKMFKSPTAGQPSRLLNQAACKAAGVRPNKSFKPNPLRGSA
jgi:hypothetical protein